MSETKSPTFWADDYGAGVPGDAPEAIAANTAGAQAALSAAVAAGGGVVYLPSGMYRSAGGPLPEDWFGPDLEDGA